MTDTRAKKTDRRVLRTRNAIREAFAELLMETDFSKITITSLAKRADVDRKTFYTHYSSIEALLEDVVRTQMEESLRGMDIRDFISDPTQYTRHLLAAVESSLPFTREQLRTVAFNVPINEFLHIWATVAKERIVSQTGPLSEGREEHLGILIEFYLGGVLNSYLYWLYKGKDVPFDEMVELLSDNVVSGISGTMGKRVKLS